MQPYQHHKSLISCDENTAKKVEAEVKQLLWEQRKKEVIIHKKVESILTKYKPTIQVYHGGTLNGFIILKLLKNHDHIKDNIWELRVDTINNRANDGHALRLPTVG